MPKNEPYYHRITINFPTNIGDTVLGLPVIDALRSCYPASQISVIASRQTEEFFSRHNNINRVLVFDKRWNIWKKMRFAFSLAGSCDLMVDLKNSLLPLVSGGKHTPFCRAKTSHQHAKDAYLALIAPFAPKAPRAISDFILNDTESKKWENYKLPNAIFIACASNALQKQYPYKHLAETIRQLKQVAPMIILGQERDRQFYKDILGMEGIVDLVGKTAIHEVFYLIKKHCQLLVCVDSSILHITSYLNIPTVALFGQNSPQRYGPWSTKYTVLYNEQLPCVPCEKPHCHMNHQCMEINPGQVVKAVQQLYNDMYHKNAGNRVED
ncbi:MAG: glycosyltransferase family 9 protein [Candidatus Omnitrophota bacterium]